ncbi:MAG TPA: hydrogen gas-evolving membrane-bound hydrogenase subunit E [Methanomicrobiales archaeon]|nr:hydrogen gas-evolving membrane-bound hydrogenase subunit E [Methanomicrobiales archaeon]
MNGRTIAIGLTMAVLTGTFFAIALTLTFGVPFAAAVDQFYIDLGQELTATNNIVTAVVFDFRGFDTLGEATVLFTSVIGTGILFRRLRGGEEHENE